MEQQIIDEVAEYFRKNEIFKPDFLRRLISFLVEKEELKEYVQKTKIIYKNRNYLGNYNFEKKKLCINCYPFLKEMDGKNNYKNYEFLVAIYHELCHAFQNYLATESNIHTSLGHFYRNMIAEICIDETSHDFYGNENYDCSILEYNSDINSYFETLEFLQNIWKNPKYIEGQNRIVAHKILNYYKDVSPIERSDKSIKEFMSDIDSKIITSLGSDSLKYIIALDNFDPKNLSELCKLEFGYPLEDKTIYKIEDIRSGKVKTLDIRQTLSHR